jgi:hypothetical protein
VSNLNSDSNADNNNNLGIIVGVLVSIIGVLVIGVIVVLLFLRKKRRSNAEQHLSARNSIELESYPILTDIEIKEKLGSGTQSFS